MYFDRLTVIIAAAALLLSILSPVISSWITGHYTLKQKRLELQHQLDLRNSDFYERHRAEVIERFITAAGALVEWNDPTTERKFGEASGEIYLYVSPSLWDDIDEFRHSIYDPASLPKTQFVDLCKMLSREAVRKPDKQQQPDKQVDRDLRKRSRK